MVESFDRLKQIAESAEGLLTDPLMKAWANDAPASMRTRFKKPLREFDKYFYAAEELVRKQMSRAMVTAFPLHTGFPPPLWLPRAAAGSDPHETPPEGGAQSD